MYAPAENRTRGPTMATLDFTTKPLVLYDSMCVIINYELKLDLDEFITESTVFQNMVDLPVALAREHRPVHTQ